MTTTATPVTFTTRIEATLVHISGTVIEDPNHLQNWLTMDGAPFTGGFSAFDFEVCPNCTDPDSCCCGDEQPFSTYRVAISHAEVTR